MAAVEKRKNAWLAFLYNHLMFMFICAMLSVIISPALFFVLGLFLSFLYYTSIYEYSKKASKEHNSPRFETEFSWKFPLYYALVGNTYFWIGIIINLIGVYAFPEKTAGRAIAYIAYYIWDSPFTFFNVFAENLAKINILPLIIFVAMFFVSSFMGYAMGKYEKSVKKFLNKFRKNKTVRKALR